MKKFFLAFTIFFSFDFVFANCRAILINGGADPANNFNVHTAQLREMYNALREKGCSEKDIHVFSASGSSTALDFRVDPTNPKSEYIANPYKFNGKTQVPNLYAADMNTLKTKIAKIASTTGANDQLFIYVADHGSQDNGKKGLVPWYSAKDKGDELFTPKDLEQALSQAPSSARVKLWTECCFCGIFNKIKRPNTCVATSTDEYHEGSYNWSNWSEYARNEVAPKALTSKTYFAGQVKKVENTSLGTAARASRSLTEQDQEIQARTFERGCFVGPRDSVEQYMFDVIGFSNKQLCLNDVLKISSNPQAKSPFGLCNNRSGFAEIDNLRKYLDKINTEEGVLNFSEKQRLKSLSDNLTKLVDAIKSSYDYKKILALKSSYEKMSPENRVKNSLKMQTEVAFLKRKIIKNQKLFKTLLEEQKIMVEALFYERATPDQIKEFKKRKKCLDEPLISQ